MVSGELRYYQAIGEKLLEKQSTRNALQAEILREVQREKIAGGVNALPVDLDRLAKHLGVFEIRDVPLSMNGRVLLDHSKAIIEVNSSLSENNKRFTIAHELAHLIIEKHRPPSLPPIDLHSKTLSAGMYHLIEELCDSCAEEILLPGKWLWERIGSLSPSFAAAEKIGAEAHCDMKLVIERAVSLGLWQCRLLWWEMKEGKFYAIKTFPSKDEAYISWVDPISPETSLPGKCLIANSTLKGKVKLRINNEEIVYVALCMPLSQTVVLSMLVFKS